MRVGDLWDTHGDPFSALIRKRLRKSDRDEQRKAAGQYQDRVGEVDSFNGRSAENREEGSVTGTGEVQEEEQQAGSSSSCRRGERRNAEKGNSGRSGIVAVWTDEPVVPASLALTDQRYKKSFYGTISYIPAIFGLYISSHVIRELLGTPVEVLLAPPTEGPLIKQSKQPKQQRQRGEAGSDLQPQGAPKKSPRLRPSRGSATQGPIEGATRPPGEGPVLSSESLIDLHSKEGDCMPVLKDTISKTFARAVEGKEGCFVGLGL